MSKISRRNFLKTTVAGGLAVACMNPARTIATYKSRSSIASQVALTTGDNRADLVFRALQPFARQIRHSIGDKLVVLKPNNVSVEIQLAATHADTLEGILEFLKSIDKLKNVVIAESAAEGSTFDGYRNFGYYRLADKYNIRLADLDQEKFDIMYVFDEKDFKPHPVRMSGMLMNPDSYIVSVARMKTHDRIIATLSLKNIVFGAPIKDIGFSYGPNRKPGLKIDKPVVHGSGFRAINYNLFSLASKLHPDLAVIDGFEGMEGNGPIGGSPVDHRICVVSPDWLAADRVGIELMGIDFAKVGYLNYCSQANMGVADMSKIEITGEPVSKHIKHYQLSKNIESQLVWMKPVSL